MGFAELHLHLEGTVDRETVMMLDPSLTCDEVDRVWAFTDFAGFLECFKFVARRLRGPVDYALITSRMIEATRQRQNVAYAEVTLGVGVVQWLGFDFDSVWRAIRQAQFEAQSEWPVEIWWNLDAIRQLGPDHVMEIAKLTARYVDDGVVSFGVGGDEQRGPATEFRAAYRYAKGAGLHLTAHAGETDGPGFSPQCARYRGGAYRPRYSRGGRSRSIAAIARRADPAGSLHYEQCEDGSSAIARSPPNQASDGRRSNRHPEHRRPGNVRLRSRDRVPTRKGSLRIDPESQLEP